MVSWFRSVVASALALFLVLPAAAEEISSHSAIEPYVGSVATRRDDDGFRSYALVVGVDAQAKTDTDALRVLHVEGGVTRLAYENPSGRSAHEIFENYRDGLRTGGFEILFACSSTECGPAYASSRWSRVTGLKYVAPDMRYLAAKGAKDGREIYVAVLVARNRHQIEVIEVAEMEKGMVSARVIGEGLATEGRAVLDGIFFETDEATIEPESQPALEVIAEFLRSNPEVNAFIVGHTDSVGALEHNMALSRARAKAVVDTLTSNHGIEVSRLSPHGVGPLSPRKANRSDSGRAENRRVEMVQR